MDSRPGPGFAGAYALVELSGLGPRTLTNECDRQPPVPTQGQTLWCGVYMMKFIFEVVCGRRPEREGFRFDSLQAEQLTQNLVLRLMESLHIPGAGDVLDVSDMRVLP